MKIRLHVWCTARTNQKTNSCASMPVPCYKEDINDGGGQQKIIASLCKMTCAGNASPITVKTIVHLFQMPCYIIAIGNKEYTCFAVSNKLVN